MAFVSTPFLSLFLILLARWLSAFIAIQFPFSWYLNIFFTSFALGTLLGNTFIQVIPHAFLYNPQPIFISSMILLGLLLFFFVEKGVQLYNMYFKKQKQKEETTIMSTYFFSIAVYSTAVGITVIASFLQSPDLGFSTALSLGFIESAKTFPNISHMIKKGISPIQAMIVNSLASTFLLLSGAAIHHFHVTVKAIDHIFLPLGAGIFMYVALRKLIPEIQEELQLIPSIIQTAVMLFGIGIIYFI